MRIAPISNYRYSNNNTVPRKRDYSYSSKPKADCTFTARPINYNYLYRKSLALHNAYILRTNPLQVEQYFARMGIPAKFDEGTEYGRKFVAYGVFNAFEIFRQLHFKPPVSIKLIDFRKFNDPTILDATGIATPAQFAVPQDKIYPPRSVFFNSFAMNKPYFINGQWKPYCWENFFEIMEYARANNLISTEHFLSPFVHEFAHTLHYDKIYSKFGSPFPHPEYAYNPKTNDLLAKLNLNLSGNNPYVSHFITKNITDNISQYGTTNLFETFAEGFTKDILNNINLFTLRLERYPFDGTNNNQTIREVLYETFEGLVGDGTGQI